MMPPRLGDKVRVKIDDGEWETAIIRHLLGPEGYLVVTEAGVQQTVAGNQIESKRDRGTFGWNKPVVFK